MRSQTGLSGQPIGVTPGYLLVPPAQETVAEKWLATIAAAKAADVNPFSGSLSLGADPGYRARCASWYKRRNWWVAPAVLGLVANAIGFGVKPLLMHPDAGVRDRLHALWNRWTDGSLAAKPT